MPAREVDRSSAFCLMLNTCRAIIVQDDNSPVSIFSYTGSNAQDARLAAARNGAKRLRVVSFSVLHLRSWRMCW